ncbi:chemotaxis-specific protein-glutamate methyltransferase CheB [Inquilinus sp.]|uniref:chemotaxis-specific protein-glutamate methyltransferase CheB n=1 Tax=Inquilinus sp. TaxID=1932117 RepID=UPI0037836A1E
MIKVLVVDDSALVRKLLGQVFAAEPDFQIEFARNGLEALSRHTLFAPDVITLDVQMPDMDGLACLDRIMVERPCPVVMVSSVTADGAEATLEALRMGAVDFVTKPTGAMSLRMAELAPRLVGTVRAAAGARLKSSLRLRDKVRHRIGGARPAPRPAVPVADAPGARSALPGGGGLVLVGTSTGGPPALEALLTQLPRSFPWPILIAQHMPASFTGALARRLDGIAALSVTEVERPTVLQPGCAYIGRGDADVIVSRRSAGLVAMPAPAQPDYLWHPSVDRLVRTAMTQVPGTQLIGILLTGMGNDGAAAMATLRARGGKTIAEAEETAVVWGMPGELAKLDGADWVLPLPRIANHLRTLVP